jgi:hypothetical protein
MAGIGVRLKFRNTSHQGNTCLIYKFHNLARPLVDSPRFSGQLPGPRHHVWDKTLPMPGLPGLGELGAQTCRADPPDAQPFSGVGLGSASRRLMHRCDARQLAQQMFCLSAAAGRHKIIFAMRRRSDQPARCNGTISARRAAHHRPCFFGLCMFVPLLAPPCSVSPDEPSPGASSPVGCLDGRRIRFSVPSRRGTALWAAVTADLACCSDKRPERGLAAIEFQFGALDGGYTTAGSLPLCLLLRLGTVFPLTVSWPLRVQSLSVTCSRSCGASRAQAQAILISALPKPRTPSAKPRLHFAPLKFPPCSKLPSLRVVNLAEQIDINNTQS